MVRNHTIEAATAKRMLEAKGYKAERLPTGFTVTDSQGVIVARTMVDVNGFVSRHALKHLLEAE